MPNTAKPVIVLAPDSFKGSLSAREVCEALRSGVLRTLPHAEIRAVPMADGGEGTLDALLASGGEAHAMTVSNAAGLPRTARYGVLRDARGSFALIEIAEVVGSSDEEGTAVSPLARSTRGVGELVGGLLDRGLRRFCFALGGSSTNDGGAGLLGALGLQLLGGQGQQLEPTPAALADLSEVDVRGLDPRLSESELWVLSDVQNPLCGERGASAVYGPQKGLAPAVISAVDAVLARYAERCERALGIQCADVPGAGAAGGLGFALLLLGATLHTGAERVADHVGLNRALAGADWAITGEGRSDAQTLFGKAPLVVAKRARAASVPVTLLSGSLAPAALPQLNPLFSGCFALTPGPATLAECVEHASEWLSQRAEQLTRLWQSARSGT